MRRLILQTFAVLFAAAAGLISYNLYTHHLTGAYSLDFLSLGCSAQGGDSVLDCKAVIESRWGAIPFKKDGDPPDKPRLPVALLGWVYYSMMIIWLVGVGVPSPSRRWLHLLPLMLNLLGLSASAFFVVIMATALDKWCTQCLVTHILNAAIFVILVLLWPRHAHTATAPRSARSDDVAGGSPVDVDHPSLRECLITLGAMALVFLFQAGALIHPATRVHLQRLAQERDGYRKVAETYRNDAKALFDNWFRREGKQIDIRPDDPIKVKPGPKPLPIVVFSDFECPQCARAARSLARFAEPLFDGRLKMVFKHYPLCTQCNQVATNQHPHACEAAYAAEAARMQNKFWEAHDWLFSHQTRLSELQTEQGMRDFARALELDETTFIGDMTSEEVIQRVFQDGEQGRRLGIKSTPAVFMEGKLLDNFFETNNPRFWKEVARAYWYDILKQTPPPQVRSLLEAKETDTIPDSPGP